MYYLDFKPTALHASGACKGGCSGALTTYKRSTQNQWLHFSKDFFLWIRFSKVLDRINGHHIFENLFLFNRTSFLYD